jgi:hypothetical protein
MTCIRKVNALDRLILRGAPHDEPACRLLVERLKWATALALVVAVVGVGLMFGLLQRQDEHARQRTAEIIASQCVDKTGNISYRNILADLVALNERRPPLSPATQRQRTGAALRKAIKEAGPPPPCILKVP